MPVSNLSLINAKAYKNYSQNYAYIRATLRQPKDNSRLYLDAHKGLSSGLVFDSYLLHFHNIIEFVSMSFDILWVCAL